MLSVDNLWGKQWAHFFAEIFLDNLLVQFTQVTKIENINILIAQFQTNRFPCLLCDRVNLICFIEDGIDLICRV